MKKAIYKDGATTYVDMTQEEIVELNAMILNDLNNWHYDTAKRIVMSYEDNLLFLKNNPFFAVYSVQHQIDTKFENGYVYIYVNYILPEHEQLFNDFNLNYNTNIQIENKI